MMLLLVPTGMAVLLFTTTANALVQLGSDPAVRGRVMALYVLVFLGTTPIGASVVGWWGQHFGVPSSIWGAGLLCFVAAVAALVWQLRASGDRIVLRVRPRPGIRLLRNAPANDEVLDDMPVSAVAGAGAPLPAAPASAVPEPGDRPAEVPLRADRPVASVASVAPSRPEAVVLAPPEAVVPAQPEAVVPAQPEVVVRAAWRVAEARRVAGEPVGASGSEAAQPTPPARCVPLRPGEAGPVRPAA
jgi:hypothetical protein